MGAAVLQKGYVQVYTGNCKGKTTASLGLAFRAMGWGLKTYIGQFMKGQYYGELKSVQMCSPYITIEQYGKDTFIHVQPPPLEEDVKMAGDGLEKAQKAMFSGEYDIIIFDEINTAHFFNLITTEQMLDIIKTKPENVEVVFTGRYAAFQDPPVEGVTLWGNHQCHDNLLAVGSVIAFQVKHVLKKMENWL